MPGKTDVSTLASLLEEKTKELKEAQAQLVQTAKMAAIGQLGAGLVHEVNNPLDGIIRYTNILLGQLESNSLAHEYLLEVKKGLNRIAHTTKSLLEFSHQFNSHCPQRKQYVDLHKLIDESIDILSDKFACGVQVVKQYQGRSNKVLDMGLAHVVINIMRNALDAMPTGGTLEISTHLNETNLLISFQDSGLGIPNEIMEHIFEPFFTTKSIDKGSGLGLAIANEIIKKYDGKIEVKSAEDTGSNFTISIPKKYLEDA